MYDAILIPGGGLTGEGLLHPWVEARFERALEVWSGECFIPLSGGTPHRPLTVGRAGEPRFEAHVGADWLRARGVDERLILPESVSYDTIGNALFARLLHTDPRGWRRLHVVTSEFHLARCRAIFDWVFSLSATGYELSYSAVGDDAVPRAALVARRVKEEESLVTIGELARGIGTLAELHEWLYRQHGAYRASRPAWDGDAGGAWLDSY